jgi:hypothetical protein
MAQGLPDYLVKSDGPVIYAIETSQLQVINTTDETTIFSTSIKGGDLSKYNFFKGRISFSYYNNTGSSRTWRIKFKLGSTVMFNDLTSVLGSGLGVRAGWINFNLSVQGTDQFLGGFLEQAYRNTASSGVGDLQISANHTATSFTGTSSEDVSTDKTLEITIQLSYAASAHFWYRDFAVLEAG